jgi:hypothetical protein
VKNRNPWAKTAMVALTVALGASLAVPPVWAADGISRAGQTTPVSQTSVAKTGMRGPEAARATQSPAAAASASTESKSFFKTGKGIAALVLMVGATAWVIASRKSGDVVHSPGRQ